MAKDIFEKARHALARPTPDVLRAHAQQLRDATVPCNGETADLLEDAADAWEDSRQVIELLNPDSATEDLLQQMAEEWADILTNPAPHVRDRAILHWGRRWGKLLFGGRW